MSDTTSTLEPRPKLADLRPLLRSAAGTPTQRALAVLTLAARLGLPTEPVRRYVSRSDDTSLVKIAKNRQLWVLLAGKARQHVLSGSSPAGRAALRREVAQRLVARLLTEVTVDGLSQRGLVTARSALGVLGTGFLASSAQGFPGDRVGEAELGTRLGASRLTARSALRTLEGMGWLTCTKRPVKAPARYKLAPLDTESKAVALNFMGIIERIGDPDLVPDADLLEGVDDPELAAVLAGLPDDSRAVEILLSARHPAWAYGRTAGSKAGLTHRHWLVLLAEAAGADPARLGMTAQSVRKCQRELDAAGVGATHPGDLTAQLDMYAEVSGAASRHAEAWAIRSAEKAAQLASLLEVRAAREQARADRRAARPKAATPAPAPKVERVTVNLPRGFVEARHRSMLQDRIVKKYGDGFAIESVDTQAGTATAVRQVA